MRIAINVVLFYVGWFACILGAARGDLYSGAGLVALLVLVQLVGRPSWKSDLLFLASVTLAGSAFDSLGILAGAFRFPPAMHSPWIYPLWMSGLWLNFAALFDISLAWMKGRYVVAAVLGVLGGPLSYYAGMELGAVELGEPLALSLTVIGLMWAVATPLVLLFSDRLRAAEKAVA